MLTLKVLYRLPLRAAQGMTRSLLQLPGLPWPTPRYSTVSKRQAGLTVSIGHRRRDEPLHLLIDSTGLKVMGEGEWKVRKHGPEYRRVWRKLHLVIDVDTHEIRAVEMTDHRHGDAGMVGELLSQLPPTAKLAALYGEGGLRHQGLLQGSPHPRCRVDRTATAQRQTVARFRCVGGGA